MASHYGLPKWPSGILSLRLVASKYLPWLSLKSSNNFNELKSARKDFMSDHAILESLIKVSPIYFKSDRKKKGWLLDHASQITGFHRKALIRRIALHHDPPAPQKKKSGAKARYPGPLLLPHVEFLWKSMERASARRMRAAFKDWLPDYHQNGVSSNIKFLLQKK